MAKPSRAGDVRAPAQIQKGSVPVDGDLLVVADLAQALQLERVVREEVAGLLARHHLALEGVIGLDHGGHALLDGRDLLRREGLGDVEVVVEAVVDRGAEADPGGRHELAHGGREDVGRRVAEHAQRLRVALGQQPDLGAVRKRAREVADFAVHNRR